jgi:nucleoside-diphosphate-sugar epimerase
MSHHLVVGAGPVGAATALRLARSGQDVVVVTRSGSGPAHPGISRVAADASSADALAPHATGAGAVYNCANPRYHRWTTDWPPIAAALLATAERSGAVLATVSNLYAYGPVDGLMTEDLPLRPSAVKGEVRRDMWLQALAAHDAGRVRVTEVRGSDYLCVGPNSQMGDRVMPRILAGKKVMVLRDADTPHTWTSVEDAASVLVAAAADARGWGRAWHVPSNAPRTQREVVADLCRVAGVPQVAVGQYPDLALRVMGLFNPVMRELPEVAYQRERPFLMDSSAAQKTFGLAPTPWDDVLAELVAAYRTPAPVG